MTPKDVDLARHANILLTMQYARDCMHVTGRVIRHVPTVTTENLKEPQQGLPA